MKLWYNTTQPGFGAVGSARALGARGQQFEPANPDHFFVFLKPPPGGFFLQKVIIII